MQILRVVGEGTQWSIPVNLQHQLSVFLPVIITNSHNEGKEMCSQLL
jgi:hypothetical protein